RPASGRSRRAGGDGGPRNGALWSSGSSDRGSKGRRDHLVTKERKTMPTMERITRDPSRLGGVPAVRNVRISVITVLRHLQEGAEEPLAAFPDLEPADIVACLAFAARTTEQRHSPQQADDVAAGLPPGPPP